jgi:signal peptidase I
VRTAPLKSPLDAALQVAIRSLWVGIIPALLAALVYKYLVPLPGPGFPGLVGRVGHQYPAVFGVACFFLFSGLVRYWRYRVPGGRYASSLPPRLAPDERDPERLRQWETHFSLYSALTSRSATRRAASRLATREREEVETGLAELGAALQSADLGRADQAAASLEAPAKPILTLLKWRDVLTTATAVLAAAVVAFAARGVVQPYRVLSASMLPTLEPGDQIAGNKMSYSAQVAREPHRGDIVVFDSSAVAQWLPPSRAPMPDVFVKRVIGLPGDKVTMRGGVPIINGWEVPTCAAGDYLYVSPDGEGAWFRGLVFVEFIEDVAYLTVQATPMPSFDESYEVQPGEVFVLGDNRTNSVDSRAYKQGRGAGVPLRSIEARAEWFLLGTHFSGNADLSRLFQPIEAPAGRLHTEGVNADSLKVGIAHCLEHRPTETRPPPRGEANALGAANPPPT